MPGLRVIGGSARGRPLRLVPGEGTRPIGDRAKEALFGILGADVEGCAFLDLFAGTGSVGIEALSRGATAAVFVDKAAPAVRTVRENLATTGLVDRATVVQRDSFAYLAQEPSIAFDYIYIAPPQYHGMWLKALRALEDKPGWMGDDAWAIVQIDPHEDEAEGLARLERFDERSYGQTKLVFYRQSAT
ncbi:MAG TPA: 16S rRNA (guanine(966)-N(2))-methyltransferase RsmD [Anaerolineales bacterium]|nr:16S rRNA (guanine(966)-N(2))-methyltransferase RsmD [Anaerolineales bacterium]